MSVFPSLECLSNAFSKLPLIVAFLVSLQIQSTHCLRELEQRMVLMSRYSAFGTCPFVPLRT